MGVYASATDVAVRYEGTISDEDRVDTFIADAEAFLLSRVPDLADRITDSRTSTQAARIVVCNLVMRRLRNPAEYKSEHDGDYGYSHDESAGWSSLASSDLELLGVRSGASGGVGTITLNLAAERRR